MLVRNTCKYFTTLTLCFFATFSAYAQELPAGNLIVTTACSISEGYTVEQVIEEARSIDIADDGPNLIFYRYPIASNGAPSNRLMRAVYWQNMEHWASNSGPLGGGAARLNEMLSCENTNRTFNNNWNVGSGGDAYAGGENSQSLVAARPCLAAPGTTVQQFYSELTNFANMYRDQGDTTLMQLSQRFLGPRTDIEMGTGFLIRTIGEDAAGLARRFDMGAPGVGTPDGPIDVTCGDPSLFMSYVAHWGL
ncbi:MAG: hypothetical protein GKR91_14755 [Pseudomonadales bacterium]|nr:hypothetical protein [Pseudomonadales bacterium]